MLQCLLVVLQVLRQHFASRDQSFYRIHENPVWGTLQGNLQIV